MLQGFADRASRKALHEQRGKSLSAASSKVKRVLRGQGHAFGLDSFDLVFADKTMPDHQILTGTAGWSYPEWEGAVYPPGKPAQRLGIVSDYLDCVEVDSSFYRPPNARTTEGWCRAVANKPDFRFLAKAWQRFTHQRNENWTPAEFELFVGGLTPLRDAHRLDALLFQFPWSFRNLPENRDWLSRIAEWFADWPVAVEVRHDSWSGDEVQGFFRQNRFIYCNIDQPGLAHCLRPSAYVTGDVGYFRLHGRNAKNWFREGGEPGDRYDYLYTEAELDELLRHIRVIASTTKRTFVIFNNHKDAKAFANALQLKLRVQPGTTVRAPVSLVARFPSLQGKVVPVGEQQLPLG